MVEPANAYIALTLLALVTLGTRLGGAFAMHFVVISPRVTRFLEAMSASVLAAIVVTFVANNAARELASVILAIAVMLATRSAIWAMFAALVLAAGWTFFTS